MKKEYYLEDILMKGLAKNRRRGIDGMPGLYRGEPAFLCKMARLAPDGVGLEIGVRFGYSIALWGKVREGRGRIIGLELVDRPLMRHHIAESGLPIEIIIGDSAEVAIPCEEIAFLFIDGDHRKKALKCDMRRYLPLIIPGGVVVFHDYKHTKTRYPYPLFAVRELVRKWHKRAGWEKIGRKRYMIAFRRPTS